MFLILIFTYSQLHFTDLIHYIRLITNYKTNKKKTNVPYKLLIFDYLTETNITQSSLSTIIANISSYATFSCSQKLKQKPLRPTKL